MEKVQAIIIILLLIAVISSVVSISMNLSLREISPVKTINAPAGNPSGGIALVIAENPGVPGGLE